MFSPQIKLLFWNLVVQKDKKKNSDKAALNTNARLRNFCKQKNIDYIDNTNIKEDHLGIKKLYLIKEAIRCLHKTYSGIYDQNIEKMLTLTVSRKVMMNINLKT